jgi:tetratricopeptide (TPR) repeat protein
MKLTIEALYKYLNYFWSRRKTKNGYFLGVLLLVILANLFTPINSLSVYWQLVLYLFLFLVFFIFWLFISGRRIPSSKKLKIAFALKSTDPSSQKIISSTILRIKDKLKSLNILNHFKFYEIGTDIFETNEQAEAFSRKRKLNLIIHGTVYGGKSESSYRYDLKNFFFTYNVMNAPKDSPVWPVISADIDLMLANRNWIIDESNDLDDIIGVADNLFEIILSIIAIGLSRSKQTIDFSILLIEKLLPILEKKIDPDQRKIFLSMDKTQLKIPIDLLRSGRLRGILNGCYINVSRILIDDGDYTKANIIIEKGIKAGAEKIDCYPVLALANYHLGNIDKAEEYTEKMKEISKDHPVYLVNKAFFSIKRKEYNKVIEYYQELRRKISEENKIIIHQVISFISARINEDKKEHAYLYSIGILTYNFINKKNGSRILSKFIKKATDNDAYTPMIKIATQLCKSK